MMRSYAETEHCRRAALLSYFGEPFEPPCGNCDACLAGRSLREEPTQHPFPINGRVVHGTFGVGTVQRYDNDVMTVLFDQVGYKTLSVSAVSEHGLLTPEEGAR
jgi:ATP-dependent DNA helicase RecQ